MVCGLSATATRSRTTFRTLNGAAFEASSTTRTKQRRRTFSFLASSSSSTKRQPQDVCAKAADVNANKMIQNTANGDATTCGSGRGGLNDSVTTLSVGGKKFQTLRSTIAANRVLMEHVHRAESNPDLLADGAVFIDRDPKHFNYILQYLRDKIDVDMSCTTQTAAKTATSAVSKSTSASILNPNLLILPNRDSNTLKEIYREALYYQMTDLQTEINCMKFTGIAQSLLGGSIKPTDAVSFATRLFTQVRTMLLAVTTLLGMGSIGAAGVMLNTKNSSNPKQHENYVAGPPVRQDEGDNVRCIEEEGGANARDRDTVVASSTESHKDEDVSGGNKDRRRILWWA